MNKARLMIVLVGAVFLVSDLTAARIVVRPGAAPGRVNLPYAVSDNSGNNWMVYQQGWLQQQGNQPLYSQGAMLTINGNQPGNRNNSATLDADTGELVIGAMTVNNGLELTRRIQFNKEQSYVRYIDIIKNTQNQEQTVNLQVQSNLNYGVQASQMVPDPKSPNQNFAWVAQTHAGRSVFEMFAGKGSKVAPNLIWPQGNSYVQAQLEVKIPAGKEIAFMHLHGTAASTDQGVRFVSGLKEKDLMADIPRELRKLIINFVATQSIFGDYEILRGEVFDVVELRGGDQFRGTLQETVYQLETFYGTVELRPERVIGLINIGQFRPRQLVVTSDGEIFGGRLAKKTIDLELTSGQVTQVPLSQVSRIGYRKRADEPEEWTFNHPFVLMRSGDRVSIQLPAESIEVMTRYGGLQLAPQSLAAIAFETEEHGVHDIQLVDGSRFAGLVSQPRFDMKRAGLDGGQVVSFPASALRRIQFSNFSEDEAAPPEGAPRLELNNNDVLIGVLSGELKLDTAFDTLVVNAEEIRELQHPEGSPMDVQLTLWDQTTVSGQLQQPVMDCTLHCGVRMTVPIGMMRHYENPSPRPSAIVLERIRSVVAELSAEDWKQRDRAEAQLISMGPSVGGVLREMQSSLPPEAQQRIDSVLKQLNGDSSAPSAPAGNPNAEGMMIDG